MSLRDEIREQPEVVARLLARSAAIEAVAAGRSATQHVDHVVIAARGTSDHAAIYAQYLFGDPAPAAGRARDAVDPVALRRRAAVRAVARHRDQPVGRVARHRRRGRRGPPPGRARRSRSPTSPARRWPQAAEHVIDLGAGPERAVAATKTYTAELLAIALLAAGAGDRRPDARDEPALAGRARRRRGGARDRARGRARGGRGARPARRLRRRRARLRVRDGARVGAQAQGAGPGRRRPVLRRRLPPRPAGARRARLPGARGRAVGRGAADLVALLRGSARTSAPTWSSSPIATTSAPSAAVDRGPGGRPGAPDADRLDRPGQLFAMHPTSPAASTPRRPATSAR